MTTATCHNDQVDGTDHLHFDRVDGTDYATNYDDGAHCLNTATHHRDGVDGVDDGHEKNVVGLFRFKVPPETDRGADIERR